jgi:polar amino acid transport system substrate-binding protein
MIKAGTKFILIVVLAITFSLSGFAQKKLQQIIERGEIRVGMTGNQPPFSMKAKDGTIIGYDADLAALLANSMGIKLKIVEIPFPNLLGAVKNGEVDIVLSGLTITMKRNMEVAFVGPYTLSGKSILTKSPDLSKVDDEEDVNSSSIKIVVLKGSTSESYVREEIPDADLQLTDDYDSAIKMVTDGKADIMVADYPVCAYQTLVYPEKGLITIDNPLTIEPIGAAINPNDHLLINLVENYFNLASMIGVLELLEIKWFETGEWVELVKE